MLRRVFMLAGLAAPLGAAEILDRIAVTIDNQVIAESDLIRDIRLSAFLNQSQPDFSGRAKRATAERLVDRALMRREIELSRYPLPGEKDAAAALENWRRERFPDPAVYRQALAQAGIADSALAAYMLEQLTALRFIDYRFRPTVQVGDAEIQQYYEKRFLPQWRPAGAAPAPPLEQVAPKIEQILVEEKVDRMLEAWLKDARSRARIVYRPAVFQ